MWKQRQNDQLVETRLFNLFDRFLQKRMPCAHAHEGLHIASPPFEFFRESARLFFCKAPQWRASADLPVIALRGFATERRNGVCQRFSKRCPFHTNDFRIGEQTVEKRFDVAESFRATEIK